MSDEIAVASLLMAILAILYGAWYSEIIRVTNLEIPRHDKAINLSITKETLFGKCIPLLGLSIVTAILFTPSLISIISHSILTAKNYGFDSFQRYSVVKAAFCVVIFSCFLISYQMFLLTINLCKKYKKLK